MLNRISQLSEDSAFKRVGDWPLLAHLTAQVVNAVNALRADLVPGTPYRPILPPAAQRAIEQDRARSRAAHDDIVAQLRGVKGS